MIRQYHREITQEALREAFSLRALRIILKANLGQDRLRGQLGHPEYHFDASAFAEGQAYIDTQREMVFNVLKLGEMSAFSSQFEVISAWEAFGRLTHAAQDLYAHSNYVNLWLEQGEPGDGVPPSEMIDPLDTDLLHSPKLRSGRIYYPWEALSYIKPLKPLMQRLLPRDSHTRMNLDTPERGRDFAYAYIAAVKRTRYEVGLIQGGCSLEAFAVFADRR